MSQRNYLEFLQAQPNDTDSVIDIAQSYPKDFETYIDLLPRMIESGRVFVVKRKGIVLGFATYGLNDSNPQECMTASARSPEIEHEDLPGDWIRVRLEKVLRQRGFRKFTAHVRRDNESAKKMLIRNGYNEIGKASGSGLLEFSKTV
jgi:hypothetical protein